jgi:hypothetical protein
MQQELPLRVLMCGIDPTGRLQDALRANPLVSSYHHTPSLDDLKPKSQIPDFDVVFLLIDAVSIFEACDLVFAIRRKCPRIVFILCVPDSLRTLCGEDFFRGERARLRHYYQLNVLSTDDQLVNDIDIQLRASLMDLALT